MIRENKNTSPIFYNNVEEMNKPVSELLEDLRTEMARTRGKIYDIKKGYGFDDRLEHLEGGLTCVISAMYATAQEMEKWEARWGGERTTKSIE